MQNTSPFSGLYDRLPDTGAYLERIGYAGEISPSCDCLEGLMRAQLNSVPFENLDVFHAGAEPSLDTEAMFDKIVTRRRGGYCFELNGLFWRLLEALGFSAYCAVGRIALGRDFLAPPAHRVIIVCLGEKRLFCDVGFGGPIPASPIEIAYDKTITCAAGRNYRFVKDGAFTTLMIEQCGEFKPMIVFSEDPADPVDFVPLNAFCAKSRIEPFVHKQMVWRLSDRGKFSIDGDILRIAEDGLTEERRLTCERELADALEEYFGIVYPHKLRDWRVEK